MKCFQHEHRQHIKTENSFYCQALQMCHNTNDLSEAIKSEPITPCHHNQKHLATLKAESPLHWMHKSIEGQLSKVQQ